MSASTTLRAVRLGETVVDLRLVNGRIVAISPVAGPASGMVLPLLADAHVHLDKTHTAHRIAERSHSLHAAIDLARADKQHWSEADIRSRAARGLGEAEANGLCALRTHIDWSTPDRPLAWDVIGELSEAWRGRVEVQRAALAPLPLLSDPEHGPRIAADVAAAGGALGAFVYRDADLEAHLEQVFALARRHDLALDFHVDEGLEAAATGFDAIVRLTKRHSLSGRVLCGHGCALSVRPEDEVRRLLDLAAEAGVGLTVLPTTNGYLQDAAPGRTPRLRGLAPMQEARSAGMDVLVGLDNVADAFYPFGSHDLLEAWRLAVLNAHLDPAGWLDSITTLPAKWIGADLPGIVVGAAADFIHADVADPAGLISHPRAQRTVYRRGQALGAASRELHAACA